MIESSNDQNNSTEKNLSSLNLNTNISSQNNNNDIDFKESSNIINNINTEKHIEINENDNIIKNDYNNNKEIIKNDYDDNNLKSNLQNDQLTNTDTPNNTHNKEFEGFDNIGSSCYMNSFLQILLYTPGFIMELKKINDENNLNNILIKNLICLYEEKNKKLYLENIKKYMGEINKSYGQYIQNDSQEFGIDLLNELISKIKNDKNNYDDDETYETINNITSTNKSEIKKELFIKYKNKYHNKQTILEKMFQFIESKLNITEQDSKLLTINNIFFETFLNVELVFPNNQNLSNYKLIDLFNYKYKFFKYDKIQMEIKNEDNNSNIEEINDNKLNNQLNIENVNTSNEIDDISCLQKFKEKSKNFFNYLFSSCSKNSKNGDDIKNISINRLASLPKVLIISINRALIGKSLINYNLIFNESLELNSFIDKDLLDDKIIKYNLYAINECYGHSKENGHYYCYIKISNKWYKFNDKKVIEEIPNFSSKYVVGLYYIKNDYLND